MVIGPYFRVAVGSALLATAAALALRVIHPFEHGVWLIAYLLLVGSAAQYLLARGQVVFAPVTHPRRAGAEALLWGIGVLTVPSGVLGDIRLLVAVGSVSLIAALILFWRTTRPEIRLALAEGRTGPAIGYRLLMAFMLGSVFVGMYLASDVPWTG